MTRELKTVDDRVNWLAEELLLAKERMAGLVSRIEALEQGRGVAVAPETAHQHHPAGAMVAPVIHPLAIDEESWTHLGQAVLLPRVAAVSFMLVVALVLRTVTDNGMIGLTAGLGMGMAYAVSLIVAGAVLYGRQSLLAPVFPTCGTILLYSIIYETRNHFASLSGEAVNLILLVAQVGVVLVGIRCRSKSLLMVAVVASTLVGIAIGLPSPIFILLGLIFLVNSVAAQVASERGITPSLRWYALLFAICFWMLWAYKLNFVLNFAPATVKAMGLPLSLPLLFLFWAFYTATSLRQAVQGHGQLEAFHHLVPAVVAGGAFFAANGVLNPWLGRPGLVGLGTVLVSALYLGLVTWLARRGREITGGKEFVTAATILLIQGLAIATPPLWALPVWTVAAAILTLRADHWQSGGIRLISYLFQLFILIFALRHGSLSVSETAWPLGVAVVGLMALVNLRLYRWCRLHPPDTYDSAFFTVFDRGDYSAVILLGLGLFQGFAACRFLLYALLPDTVAQTASAFACMQSVIINLGIVLLLVVGLRKRAVEIVTVGGGVVLVAAIKVFIDLFQATGLPLVLSVFSFGVVAATSSLVMRKWQREGKGEG
jgi:hypothetical protein